MTRGQKFEAQRQKRLKIRSDAMKKVIPYVVEDVHAQIDLESKADPNQTTFTIYLTDILNNTSLYSSSYFNKACGGANMSPFISELFMFANAVMDDSVGQDFDVRIEANGERVLLNFSNVANLAEKRISQ